MRWSLTALRRSHCMARILLYDLSIEKNLILLGSILIFMDQQITAVIVNRKEHKLEVSEHTIL
jgi:hypothetical protein